MSDFRKQNWFRKFANAFRGIGIVVATQRSFWVHLTAALMVLALGWWLKVSEFEGLVLGLCVLLVMTAEVFNTALEFLARRITDKESELIRNALDAAAGAVLIASLGAAAIGLWILGPRLFQILGA